METSRNSNEKKTFSRIPVSLSFRVHVGLLHCHLSSPRLIVLTYPCDKSERVLSTGQRYFFIFNISISILITIVFMVTIHTVLIVITEYLLFSYSESADIGSDPDSSGS